MCDPEREASLYGGADLSQADMDARHLRVLSAFRQPIDNGRVEVIRATSREAVTRFEDESLDFVYVDGDHSYDEVAADLREFLPKLRPGGLLLADDYRTSGWWGDAVVRACHELVARGGVTVELKIGAQIVFRKA